MPIKEKTGFFHVAQVKCVSAKNAPFTWQVYKSQVDVIIPGKLRRKKHHDNRVTVYLEVPRVLAAPVALIHCCQYVFLIV